MVGLTFVAMGLFNLRRDPAMAVGCIALFGLCAALGIRNIVRKRRNAQLRPLSVEIVGGVPLRPNRLYTTLVGGSILVLGLALIPGGLSGPKPLLLCAAVMIAAGGAIVAGVLFGKLPVGSLQFDEGGLTIGERADRFTVAWDNVRAVWPGEFHDNAALFLTVRDLDALLVHPVAAKARVIRRLRTNEAWVTAHVMILTGSYGLDLPLLVAAIESYVGDPTARTGLSVRRLPAPSARQPEQGAEG